MTLWGALKFLSLLYGNVGVYEVMEDSRMKCAQTFSFFLKGFLRASNRLWSRVNLYMVWLCFSKFHRTGKALTQKDLEIYHSNLPLPAQFTGNLKHGAVLGLLW